MAVVDVAGVAVASGCGLRRCRRLTRCRCSVAGVLCALLPEPDVEDSTVDTRGELAVDIKGLV